MFERFSKEARTVVVDAQVHARRLGHTYIGCEHLLLAVSAVESQVGECLRGIGVTPEAVEAATRRLVGTPGALDRDALAAIGIDLDAVREKVEASFGPHALETMPSTPLRRRWGRRAGCDGSRYGHIPFTPRAKKVLETALREAASPHQRHIGAEHIALALTSMHDGLAPQIFAALATPPGQVRTGILNTYRQAS